MGAGRRKNMPIFKHESDLTPFSTDSYSLASRHQQRNSRYLHSRDFLGSHEHNVQKQQSFRKRENKDQLQRAETVVSYGDTAAACRDPSLFLAAQEAGEICSYHFFPLTPQSYTSAGVCRGLIFSLNCLHVLEPAGIHN